MNGLKIRVMENPVYIDTFKALGANPVPMAWTEALTAMQQGTIDGQENPINIIYSFKLYEPQKHLSLTRQYLRPCYRRHGAERMGHIARGCTVGSKQHSRLRSMNGIAMADGAQQLQALRDNGMQIVDAPDLGAFQAQIGPVYEKYGAKFGSYL